MNIIILIVLIIYVFYTRSSNITGGRSDGFSKTNIDFDNKKEGLLKYGFDPNVGIWDPIRGVMTNYTYEYKRYTRINQVQQITKYGNKHEYARLTELLSKFVSIPISRLCNYTSLSDFEIKKLVKKQFSHKPSSNIIDNEYYGKDGSIVNFKQYNILKHVSAIKKIWCMYSNIENYLDYGCSDGTNTRSIGKLLGAKNIHGCDVVDNKPKDVIFTQVTPDTKLPYADNTFEVISVIHVMHHIDNLKLLISEFRRILKPYGVMYIIDHRIHNDIDAMLIDIEHWLWDTMGSKVDGEYSVKKYLNYKQYDKLFGDEKFYCINSNIIYYNILEQPTPTNSYFMIYFKNGDDKEFIKNKYLYNQVIAFEELIGRKFTDKFMP